MNKTKKVLGGRRSLQKKKGVRRSEPRGVTERAADSVQTLKRGDGAGGAYAVGLDFINILFIFFY